MYRFFVSPESISEGMVRITGGDVAHISHVLRMKVGEEIVISDQSDLDYYCEITSISREEVLAKVRFTEPQGRELPISITLLQGLPKGDKMELILQKAVELGAVRVVPVETARSVVRLDEKKAKSKVERWNAIAEGAAKQSGRGIVPPVTRVMNLKEALSLVKEEGLQLIVPYENARGMQELKTLLRSPLAGSYAILIGPEGGLEEREVEMAKEAGAKVVSLGARILRTETAGMALISAMMLEAEMETDERQDKTE